MRKAGSCDCKVAQDILKILTSHGRIFRTKGHGHPRGPHCSHRPHIRHLHREQNHVSHQDANRVVQGHLCSKRGPKRNPG